MRRLAKWLRPEANRGRLYRYFLGIGLALGAAGIVTDGKVQAALLLGAAVLGIGGNGLATNNTTTKEQ